MLETKNIEEPKNWDDIVFALNMFLVQNQKVSLGYDKAKKFYQKIAANLITPEKLHYFCPDKDQKFFGELSMGEGIEESTYLYGVSIYQYQNNEIRHTGYSRAFQSIFEAFDYILELFDLF